MPMTAAASTDDRLVDEDTFIALITAELAGASRITPFLGSGVSAQSGIIMGEEFPKYLAWTVSQVLQKKWDLQNRGWPPFPSSDEKEKSHKYLLEKFLEWCRTRNIVVTQSDHDNCPRITSLRMPEQPDHQEQIGSRDIHLMRPLVPEILRDGHIWDKEDFLDTAKRNLRIPDEPTELNTPDSSEEYIVEVALRALSHWTRTLEFLARVRLTSGLEPRLYLEAKPEISVIDGFNAHITRGKRPNLIHNMVSRLARSMRTRLVLTTNFDTLLEQSYRAQGEPLHMLAVSIKGGLPAYATVRAQDCVVKLHGDILETRADTSINEPPTPADKQRFFQYLRGPNKPHKKQPDDFVPSHLLVLGYSASDPRCVQMIRYTLDMDPGFKVFWTCHTPRDVQRVQRFFGMYKDRVFILQTDRTDLLLWALYQKLNFSLPGGGHSLEFTQHVPPRSALFDHKDAQFEQAVEALHELVLQRSEQRVVYIDCSSGTTQPMQAVFGRFKKSHYHAVWFELEDYRNTDDFYYNLLSLISLNLGYFQLEWINFAPRRDGNGAGARMHKEARKRRLRLLVEKFKINPERWVLFLYGRNGAGGCTGLLDGQSYWSKDELADLDELLVFLSTVGFKIVYMPRGPRREQRDHEMMNKYEAFLREHLGAGDHMLPELPQQACLPHPEMDDLTDSDQLATAKDTWLKIPDNLTQSVESDDGTDRQKVPNFINILTDVVSEFGIPSKGLAEKIQAQKSARAIWLYGLTLLRQSRHPAATISEAIFPCPWRFCESASGTVRDNDEYRHRLIYEVDETLVDKKTNQPVSWMQFLQSRGLFLRKPGGNSWMYRDTRLGLQTFYELSGEIGLYVQPFDESPRRIHTLKGLRNVRARLHYWIGDWYLRAFYSSGHFIPLVEAIYHSCRAIIHAPEYEWIIDPKSEAHQQEQDMINERLNLVWKSVCQFRKLLLVGRRSLLFWCPGVDIKQCFFEQDLSVLRETIKDITHKAMLILDDSQKSGSTKSRGGRQVKKKSAGETISICQKLNELAEHVLEHELNHLQEAVLKEAFAHGGRTSPVLSSQFLNAASCEYVAPPEQAWKEVEPPLDRSHDWREDIMEKMADVSDGSHRSHGRPAGPVIMTAEDLKRRFAEIIEENEIVRKTALLTKLRRDWLFSWSAKSGDESVLFRMIWLISEMMYRILRRAKLEYHSHSISQQEVTPTDALFMCGSMAQGLGTNEPVRERWRIVSAMGYQALQMCRSLSPDYHQADCDLRVRVLTLYAVSLGYLNRFSEANRRFNEAHAIILSGMGWPDGRELARIHIRRAEVLIWNARYDAHVALSAYVKAMSPSSSGAPAGAAVKHVKLTPAQAAALLVAQARNAISCLDDAWAALERGELCLGGVSHSAYWWYRLLSQKLCCYATLGTLASQLRKHGVAFDFDFSCLPFRRKIHLPTTLLSLMRDALIVGAGDLFRQLRVLEYAMIADAGLNPVHERVFSHKNEKHRLFTQITHPELYKDVLRVLEYEDPESSRELGENMNRYLHRVRDLWQLHTGKKLRSR